MNRKMGNIHLLMHLNAHFLALGIFLFVFAVPLRASDRFLQKAISEDRMLNEISERITTINRRQIESNVFSEKEIADLSDTGNTVSGVKTQQMKRIITELGKSIQTDSTQTVQTHRKNARNEYKEAVSILNNLTFLASEKELRLRMSTRTLIEDQRQLLNETRKLQKEQEAKNSLDENDIEQSWDMAEQQRALRADAPNDRIRKQMLNAAIALQNLDIPQAAQQQQQLLDELENNIKKDSGEMYNNAEDLTMATGIEQSLTEIGTSLSDAIKQENPMDNTMRQEMAAKMGEISNQMADLKPLTQAATEINEGIMDLMQKRDQQSLEHIQQALTMVKQNKQQILSQMQAPKMQQQTAQQEIPNASNQETANAISEARLDIGERKKNDTNADWKATLPPKERKALLAARKAKYLPEMEAEVKNYFVDLAK